MSEGTTSEESGTTSEESGGFRRGVAAVDEAYEKAKSRTGNFPDTTWFRWEDGEKKIIRFLLDMPQVYVVLQHEGIVGHDGQRHSLVCRQENPTDKAAGPVTCEGHDIWEQTKGLEKNKRQGRPREMIWGLAALRSEHRDGEGRIDGFMDVTEEYEKDGEKKPKPIIGIVKQASTNFWHQPRAYFERYGTLKDRDYEIQRRGASLDTTYTVVPLDKLESPEHR